MVEVSQHHSCFSGEGALIDAVLIMDAVAVMHAVVIMDGVAGLDVVVIMHAFVIIDAVVELNGFVFLKTCGRLRCRGSSSVWKKKETIFFTHLRQKHSGMSFDWTGI